MNTERFAPAVVSLLRNRMDELMEAVVTPLEDATPGILSHQDIRQVLDGFVSVVDEALHDREPETRHMYMTVIYPALLRQGVTAAALLSSSTNIFVHSGAFLAQTLPENVRPEALRWLARFYGEYIAELAAVTAAGKVKQ